jgi:fumarylacetoacetase
MEAFLDVDPSSDFSIDNLPYGAYTGPRGGAPRPCTAIGDSVVDLAALQAAGLFSGPVLAKHPDCFQQVPAVHALRGGPRPPGAPLP